MHNRSPIVVNIDRKRARSNIRPIELGIEYTKRYRELLNKNANQLKQIFDLPKAESFDVNAIALLLKQKDAEGIRIYYGVESDKGKNLVRLILVPIDKNGKDIIVPLIKRKRRGEVTGTLPEQDEDDEDQEQDEAQQTASEKESSEQDTAAFGAESDAEVVNSGQRCPDVCDPHSVLNKA